MSRSSPPKTIATDTKTSEQSSEGKDLITFFLCGDVMTGRGIDQVLPHPSDPILYESYVRDARVYVGLAEKANGPFRKPMSYAHIWGDALGELDRVAPDLRIINLETSVTTSSDHWPDKGINYRMHPKNIDCLGVAKIDLCVLANNHVLDWGYPGLIETLETLNKANIKYVGAGNNLEAAEAPAILEVTGKGRVIVFSFGFQSSGIPLSWTASKDRPGVNLLRDFSDGTLRSVEAKVRRLKQPGDVLIASIHWGGNWEYAISAGQIAFAHSLIDRAGMDVVYGHSSHHVKSIEIYSGKPIFYGCGDFLNDYEGIGRHKEFRGDLGLMYFVTVDHLSGKLVHLRMTPTHVRNLRVNRASRADALWLRDTLNREGALFGTRVELIQENGLTLLWD
jgi:poly-gamma-glutamate capsule biosynthesis protein CapA/YwtB (metallophosphatase superfamily)